MEMKKMIKERRLCTDFSRSINYERLLDYYEKLSKKKESVRE